MFICNPKHLLGKRETLMKENMKKFVLFITLTLAASSIAQAQVIVKADEPIGKIKMMNSVNNGPEKPKATQKRGNFKAYKDAGFPYARLHDAPIRWGWAHTVDISCVFPDFEADVDDPKSYDFSLTDLLVADIQEAGTKVFYRLGQSIEHWQKKYGVLPPKDFKKWAQICEHIIRHYNEGWADGHHYDIKYWEIWNEPDLGFKAGRHLKNDSPTWNGSDTDFFKFYEIVSKHLNKCFSGLKIGGPALCEDNEWAERFLAYMSEHKVDMDFFSYHLYAGTVEQFQTKNNLIKGLLDKYGYSDTEMILDEWNYLSNWTDEYVYTLESINSYKGAVYTAAIMQACQDGPVDMLMYYDARPGTAFNGLFNLYSSSTMPAYYAMYSWKKLRNLGVQVKTSVVDLEDVYATAAKSEDGKLAVLISYYTDDKEKVAPIPVSIDFQGIEIREAISHITDKYKTHTETPIEIEDSKACVFMEANSYILIEIR